MSVTMVKVRPWEVRKGDRIVGTSMIADGPARYEGFLYADTVEQQRYVPGGVEVRGLWGGERVTLWTRADNLADYLTEMEGEA